MNIKTKHGHIKTPFFMPDATRALVKGLNSRELGQAGVKALVVNTFHLYLQPGMKIIKKA
ncbi:tRNA-guanine transglycosylase, partial [Candidatus Falkowbacteria bacterium]|nr:tRNA-guanine transglycosylase [Candidatus Falkowbacteria bacterium]